MAYRIDGQDVKLYILFSQLEMTSKVRMTLQMRFRQWQYTYVRHLCTVAVDISGCAVIYCMYTAATLSPSLVIKNKCAN